ncbi:MAG: type IV secretory system conjugative DNA transfer family protein [Gemmataceae bacterium]
MLRPARPGDEDAMYVVFWLAVLAAMVLATRFRWRPAMVAYGTAAWMTVKDLRAWGLLGSRGLVLGRTLCGRLIRLPRYVAVLVVGGAGSGKGVGLIIPNLLAHPGSAFVFDTKGDLFAQTVQRRRQAGHRILRLAPFSDGEDAFNPCAEVRGGPHLIDDARALAESLVSRAGTESDPFWNDKAAQLITAVLLYVLLRLKAAERGLASVLEILCDTALLAAAADNLREAGGVPGRYAGVIKGLFTREGVLTKEGASVVSMAQRHLDWLNSDLIGRAVERSTFQARDLLEPGVTLYLQVPPGQLEAARGYLRCVLATLLRVIGREGDERRSEVLVLIDEASAVSGLAAVEEALVRGRSAGVRLFLAFQSTSQVEAAFPEKKTLLFDNCDVQIYLCPPAGYDTAEKLSKMCGEHTQIVDNYSENQGSTTSGTCDGKGGWQISSGSSLSYQQAAKALLRPEQILTLPADRVIAFVGGLPGPILCRKVKWYADPAFARGAGRAWSLFEAAVVVMVAFAGAVFAVAVLTAMERHFQR